MLFKQPEPRYPPAFGYLAMQNGFRQYPGSDDKRGRTGRGKINAQA
jgi:hypothetical protein